MTTEFYHHKVKLKFVGNRSSEHAEDSSIVATSPKTTPKHPKPVGKSVQPQKKTPKSPAELKEILAKDGSFGSWFDDNKVLFWNLVLHLIESFV